MNLIRFVPGFKLHDGVKHGFADLHEGRPDFHRAPIAQRAYRHLPAIAFRYFLSGEKFSVCHPSSYHRRELAGLLLMVERETVCQLESRSLSEPPVRIASRCYTSDHVVTAFQQEGYFGRSRVGGYSRLEIGGSATVKEVDFRQCRAT